MAVQNVTAITAHCELSVNVQKRIWIQNVAAHGFRNTDSRHGVCNCIFYSLACL